MKEFKIGSRNIREDGSAPAFIIAEMAWAHDGSVEKAIRIAQGAAQAGADAISIHLTSLPHYMVRHYGNVGTVSAGKPSQIYDYLEKINPSVEDYLQVAAATKEGGLALCVMPNDFPSLEASERLSPDAYVLSAACFLEENFIRAIGGKGKPVILRMGGATLEETEKAILWLEEVGAKNILLLHGFQVYPTAIEELHLRAIATLRTIFGHPVGLADHIDGGDELALVLPSMALAFGAAAIEKHITWDRLEKGEDFESALDPAAFKKMVGYIRAAQKALGQSAFPPLTPAALKYRQVSRKRLVAAADIPAGTVLKSEHMISKRSDHGASPQDSALILGRQLRKPIKKDEPLDLEAIKS